MGININIIAGQHQNTSSVSATGVMKHVITDTEKTTFMVNDREIKGFILAMWGRAPNDAYLRKPTPWGDLYQTYGWPEVHVNLRVESIEILEVTSKPIIVKTQKFINNSSKKANFDVSIYDSVENKTTSTWITAAELSVGQKLTYGIEYSGSSLEAETSISFKQSWGRGGSESTSVEIGTKSGLNIDLAPGESVIGILSANLGKMKVRVTYNAYLDGVVALNFNPPQNGHHFWGLDIADVLSNVGASNSITSVEDIEVGYYSNSKIELRDLISNELRDIHLIEDTNNTKIV